MSSKRIYESSSGDTWDLVQEGSGTFVVHTPNPASGGRPSQVDVDTFLRRDPHSAEHAALSALLAATPDPAGEAAEVTGYIHDPKEPGGPYIAVVLAAGQEPAVTLHTSYAEAERELAARLAQPKQTMIAHHQTG